MAAVEPTNETLTKPQLIYPSLTGNGTTLRKEKLSDASVVSRYEPPPPTSTTINIEAITLSWHNLNVWLPAANNSCCGLKKPPPHLAKPKQILNNVSGIVRPGELLALMGASGAGKTTLLNMLTGRNRGALKLDGNISINGKKIDKDITSISAYVQQVDLFVGTMTVREHLTFQSQLRMDKEISQKDRLLRVEEVIVEMGLSKSQHTVIGIPGRIKGISGGEMKRLAFASEVLTNPPLMFCDEPTSGLDSFMAQNMVSVMKDMAARGKTVIVTIHQPSSEVFAMFDRLLLMSEGRVAYLGGADKAQEFFAQVGLPCPANFNPADHYIYSLAIVSGREAECRARAQQVCDTFASSKRGVNIAEVTQKIAQQSNTDLIAVSQCKRSPYKAGWMKQFQAVLWRSYLSVKREPLLVRVRLIQTVFIAVLLGLIYLRQRITSEGVANINGAIFIFLTNLTFGNVFAVVGVFTGEVPIFIREHTNGMYRVDVYFLCKILVEVPTFVVIPFIFITIGYWMTGMYPDTAAYFVACGIIILFTNAAVSFGYFISCAAGSNNLAMALAPACIIPLLLFGGFFLNNSSVPPYFIWLAYLSWFKYGNEALAINQWSRVTNITCSTSRFPCASDGHAVLEQLHYHEDNMAFDIWMLIVLIVGYRLAAFIALALRARRQ
ncbi:Protein white [Hypsibius exemplaris]|uniref:Protein white n=1 Tax=Hypsibius exemplaris TaxID=2072580 RepID=A0A9X6NAW1_HYPEX|nr:Protein white [Hypsibius exemplaris]